MTQYFGVFRRFLNFFMNVFIKSDSGRLEKNLVRDIDIINLRSPNFLHSFYRYLTPDEIRRGKGKKYSKRDKTPTLWVTFAEMFPTEIFDGLHEAARNTLFDFKPLDTKYNSSLLHLWKGVFYFDRQTMAFYNLSRIKSYTIREEFGYTELLLSNDENFEKNFGKKDYNAYITIRNKDNIQCLCLYLKNMNHPLANDITCLMECMDIVDEYDDVERIFNEMRKSYVSDWR